MDSPDFHPRRSQKCLLRLYLFTNLGNFFTCLLKLNHVDSSGLIFKVRVKLEGFTWHELTYFGPRCSILWYIRHVSTLGVLSRLGSRSKSRSVSFQSLTLTLSILWHFLIKVFCIHVTLSIKIIERIRRSHAHTTTLRKYVLNEWTHQGLPIWGITRVSPL